MTITKELNGDQLLIKLGGSLDTLTSPELEKVINESIAGVTHLIFDFEHLEYISSAGLRVVLLASKIMAKQGTMNLVNVPDNIKDIFDMTGFSEILNIE